MGYKFLSGTCLVSNIYETFTGLLAAAGWQNISSKPATDYEVWYSSGGQGNKRLIIQLRKDSNSNVGYRFIADYTPGAAGGGGTIQRTTAGWRSCRFFSNAFASSYPQSNQVSYKYHANKDRLIFYCEATYLDVTMYNGVIYLGSPDVMYHNEPGSKSLCLLAGGNYSYSNYYGDISDALDGRITSSDTIYCSPTYIGGSYTDITKSPSPQGNYVFTPHYVKDGNNDLRGKLTGLYIIYAKGALHGDIVKIGTRSFYLAMMTGSYGFFRTSTVAEYITFLAFEV
ncbi:hypothetical protein DFP93_101253 [Aneurinibacillus soli]|uniref:Uncharacterized protein n=1 Tax=Aneurinibacillus soli TaxID=1500254 RepID=A0A0U5B1L5_9BACL|nr:hypothetical protein [Aneurinibacillus soli]PYE64227.1 hypothetical protein DFP93_101253 [Aneurinibacillus soli]BAU28176.1 hypothetical protein CB4_02350 [Aneurinibacillus soli]